MPEKELINYVKNQLSKGYGAIDIIKVLAKSGYTKAEIDQSFKHVFENKKRRYPKIILAVLLIILILSITAGAIFYFKYISPISVKKPEIGLPGSLPLNSSSKETNIESAHITYLVNEMGGYKLHNSPISGEKPLIEFKITDTNEVFRIIVENNLPKAVEVTSGSPDLRITAGSDTIKKIINSKNLTSDIVRYAEKGEILIVALKDDATLAVKGYKSIYDGLMKGRDMPTGRFFSLTKKQFHAQKLKDLNN